MDILHISVKATEISPLNMRNLEVIGLIELKTV